MSRRLRRMPEVHFDALDLPPTGTLPVALDGASRYGGARDRQQARHAIRPREAT
ncbi:MAG: hypothetical protein AB1679_11150 [Actinomycetota bacterium]